MTDPETPNLPPSPHPAPHAALAAAGFGAARWTGGFWAARTDVVARSLVPAMGRLMQETERHRWIGNFLTVLGEGAETRHRGPKWNDGDFYKWLEAASAVHHLTRDPNLDAMLDELIALVARVQSADGYIHTPQQIALRFGIDQPRFADPMHFEMYNMGHLISAAIVHHQATGKRSLLDCAIKAAEFLDRHFASPTPDMARHGICPWHLVALVDLYRHTAEPRYLRLAQRLLAMRDLVTRGDDDNQDRIPFRRQRTAHGHAVRATYLYAGATDIYTETGDIDLLDTVTAVWDDLATRKLYITGGCGALYDGASPDGAADQPNITRVHQAFGRNYQLPNSVAHNETCAAIGNMLWSWRMLLATGRAHYGDLVEHTLYNSVLAGVSLDGTRFTYTNTLRRLSTMPADLRYGHSRSASLSCYCCPPNVARVLARSADFAYALAHDVVTAVVYGSSLLETVLPSGQPLRLVQQTDYPVEGRIVFTIEKAPASPLTLRLRIPSWAAGATVCLNDGWATSATPGTFHEIRRQWTPGDRVELDLPIEARLVEAHPLLEEARNHAAVIRGPIVYCLESHDLPPGVNLLDVHLVAGQPITEARHPALGDLVILETAACCYLSAPFASRPFDALYRPLSADVPADVPIRLVPYFAWDNRGQGEMSVWLPVQRL